MSRTKASRSRGTNPRVSKTPGKHYLRFKSGFILTPVSWLLTSLLPHFGHHLPSFWTVLNHRDTETQRNLFLHFKHFRQPCVECFSTLFPLSIPAPTPTLWITVVHNVFKIFKQLRHFGESLNITFCVFHFQRSIFHFQLSIPILDTTYPHFGQPLCRMTGVALSLCERYSEPSPSDTDGTTT